MSWHVRYFSPSLKQDLLSPEMRTRNDALEAAWGLADKGEDVTAIEGPGGEIVSADEVELWSRDRSDGPA